MKFRLAVEPGREYGYFPMVSEDIDEAIDEAKAIIEDRGLDAEDTFLERKLEPEDPGYDEEGWLECDFEGKSLVDVIEDEYQDDQDNVENLDEENIDELDDLEFSELES